jgi:hypothetical protein
MFLMVNVIIFSRSLENIMLKKILLLSVLASLLLAYQINVNWLFYPPFLTTHFTWFTNLLIKPVYASTQDGTERIVSFDSEIVVEPDSQLQVTEKITVLAQGKQIKRGIYRDFPLTSPFSRGKVPFQVVKVERNGEDTHYRVENRGESERISIYKPDVYLEPGIYTYRLTYRTGRQLDLARGGSEQDRLFWNVTGQDWRFSIDQASAVVYLPDSIPTEMIELSAFTGRQGEKGQNYRGYIDQEGRPRFVTTASLAANEGLSIIVKFPTGYLTTHISDSSGAKTLSDWISHFQEVIKYPERAKLIILIFLFTTLPFIIWLVWISWLVLGALKTLSVFERTPPVHCTEPPDNLSPTAMYFVENQKPPHLMVPLWTLAARGNLTIHRQKSSAKSANFRPHHDNYYLEYTRNQEKAALEAIPLSEAEQKMFGTLRWKLLMEKQLEISPINREEFSQLEKILKEALETEFKDFRNTYFPYQKFKYNEFLKRSQRMIRNYLTLVAKKQVFGQPSNVGLFQFVVIFKKFVVLIC